jgi:hypothetical protein
MRWIEKMETVLDIRDCLDNQHMKYTTCSFQGKTLTWWNTQLHARGRDAAMTMTWDELKALLI